MKTFDLNIEEILENWEVYHAIREVIANALDETTLREAKEVEIYKEKNEVIRKNKKKKEIWHIRDYGSGIDYTHLTQKENIEKKINSKVIGKFGIGLKDALATFDRKGIKVEIKSKYGIITTSKISKHNFKNLEVLHAIIHPSEDENMVGTDFIIEGCTEQDIDKAKRLFLRFSGDRILETTKFGQVLEKKSKVASIYIKGVKAAEEENFLFSYNITNLTKEIDKNLNRERTNIGRNAYTNRVKQILLQCKDSKVANALKIDLREYETGFMHDELGWKKICIHACKIINSQEKVVFLTAEELKNSPKSIDRAIQGGYEIITIPANIINDIRKLKDINGKPIRDLLQFTKEFNESFKFKFIIEKEMSKKEKEIYNYTDAIFDLIGGKPGTIKEIRISETMSVDTSTFAERLGLWIPKKQRIIIKREQLQNLEDYSGTLLHEISHATSSASDITRKFEKELTKMLGKISAKSLQN